MGGRGGWRGEAGVEVGKDHTTIGRGHENLEDFRGRSWETGKDQERSLEVGGKKKEGPRDTRERSLEVGNDHMRPRNTGKDQKR